jgi:2-iminobutanoate/2-iminopropanoate deaminase
MYTSEGKKIVSTDKAPKAIGPYSQAVRIDTLVYTAGQVGLDPVSGELIEGGLQAQTRQVLTNLQNVLEAAGSGLGYVIKTTVFLKDMNDAGLPKGALVEIDAVALLTPSRGD